MMQVNDPAGSNRTAGRPGRDLPPKPLCASVHPLSRLIPFSAALCRVLQPSTTQQPVGAEGGKALPEREITERKGGTGYGAFTPGQCVCMCVCVCVCVGPGTMATALGAGGGGRRISHVDIALAPATKWKQKRRATRRARFTAGADCGPAAVWLPTAGLDSPPPESRPPNHPL